MERIGDFKRAILIGNSTFPESGSRLSTLIGPGADVDSLHAVLADEECCWFNPIQVLKDAPHYEVLLRINESLRDAKQEDLVLVYYSGHGLLDNSGQLYLATADTNPDLLAATALAVSQIRTCLSQSRCQRLVFILDCCYAGSIGVDFLRRTIDQELNGFSEESASGVGEFVMTASTAIEPATRNSAESLSVFTKHLVEGLRSGEADVDGDGVIRLMELFDYVKERVLEESSQEPQYWASGSAQSFILARTEQVQEKKLQAAVRRKLREPNVCESLPEAILEGVEEIARMPTDEFRKHHAATVSLAYGWARGEIELPDFIDQWFRVSADLAGADQGPDVQLELRWRTVQSARQATLELVGPTYLLDANFHFLDWNPVFDEIVAKPLQLVRGSHARDFIIRLENQQEVVERAQKVFTEDNIPLVDIEPLVLQTELFGKVQFRKIASQIAEDYENGRHLVWCVTLNIDSVEKPEELWAAVSHRLKEETNWSRYAVSYDEMLLQFPAYHQLLGEVVSLIGDARYCADLGAGTGNGSKALLDGNEDRRVWAFESNENMIQHLRSKIRDSDLTSRLTVFKGDIALSLREFPEAFFDAAIMVNVLYALDQPRRCLEEIYRVLKPDGILSLSTSHRETDVPHLFEAIRDSLEGRSLLDSLASTVDDAEERNMEMLANIQRYTREEILQFITSVGFEVQERIDHAYEDAVIIIKAKKPGSILPTRSERNQIFVSYSHKDKDWLDQVNKFFSPSFGASNVKAWDDSGITVGADWEAAINAAIARSRIAVLLVSQDFLASEFITKKELPAILEAMRDHQLQIVWIPLSAGLYNLYGIDKLQAAHDPDDPLDQLDEPQRMEALTAITQKIAGLLTNGE